MMHRYKIIKKEQQCYLNSLYYFLKENKDVSNLYTEYKIRCEYKGKSVKTLDSWLRHKAVGFDTCFEEPIEFSTMCGRNVIFSSMRELALFWTLINKGNSY